MEYRKKPVVIQAVQWDGVDRKLLESFMRCSYVYNKEDNTYSIFTYEGKMIVSVGDFVIRGVQGEFYPCKPDIFAETYERVL